MSKTKEKDRLAELNRLREAEGRIYRRRIRLEEEVYIEVERPALEAIVGKCFRLRNCYSCPEKASDYWWTYYYVTGIAGREWVWVVTFQTDKDGVFGMETLQVRPRSMMKSEAGEAEEISKETFNCAFKAFLDSMQKVMDSPPKPEARQ